MSWHAVCADALVGFHVAYVGFVVVGLLVILLGVVCRWGWVRNFTFRVAHLAAIAVVVVEEAFHVTCPLTTWENQLRAAAGQDISEVSFMGQLFRNVLFWNLPPWAFTLMHVAFGALVLATFLLVPPRLPAALRAWRPGPRPSPH